MPAPRLPPLSLEVDEQIGRLAARTAAAAALAPVRRDLFTFAAPRVPRAATTAPTVPAPAAAAALDVADLPAAAQPWLAGVADMGAGALTAVVSLRDHLHYVKKGDVIDGRYRVERVSVEGVDVFDLALGTTLHLSLQL